MSYELITLTFAITAGLAVAGGAYSATRLAFGHLPDARLRERLRHERFTSPVETQNKRIRPLVRLGERLAGLFLNGKGETTDGLRRRLLMAGIYHPKAAKMIVAVRMVLLFAGVIFGSIVAMALNQDLLLGISFGGGAGYLTPKLWLSRRIRTNHKLLSRSLPDGLDLMVVCVEAGLTVDGAMQRVSQELQLPHPALAREMGICHMETQVGLSRQQALRNLGERAGFAPLKSLTAMLTQAERFGTSIAASLRIQADAMRRERQHRAEELAAKAAVKLSFPLVLFIFPATFIVMLGPMIINFLRNGLFGG